MKANYGGRNMRVLQIDASARRAHSSSRMLSAYFIARLRHSLPDLALDYIDTAADCPPPLNATFIEALYTTAAERSPAMKQALSYSDNLCARALMADMLVCAMPMYNFCMPASFKALIDQLVRVNLTYTLNADGSTSGKLAQHKILFITTRGADLRPGSPWHNMDALRPALQAAFAFMGADDPVFVDVQPLENNDSLAKNQLLAQARHTLDALASRWLTGI
jgi:FMN-dependent NADH-azoreductase